MLSFLEKIGWRQPSKNECPPRFRVSPRVYVNRARSVRVDVARPFAAENIPLINLSSTGVGFVRAGREWPETGTSLSGVIYIQQETLSVEMRVVHMTEGIVGCEFVTQLDRLASLVNRYFWIEISAIRLSRVRPDFLQQPAAGTAHWYRGRDDSELYFVLKDREVILLRISFLGHMIQYEPSGGIRYGSHHPDETGESAEPSASGPMNRLSSLPPDVKTAAVHFIENIRELPPENLDALKTCMELKPHSG